MNLPIENIEIENFKSIKRLEINNCARINLFIGKPNVGKSNIIEALSVFSLPYSTKYYYQLNNQIRIENEPQLFYDGNYNEKAQIIAGRYKASVRYTREEGLSFDIFDDSGNECLLRVTDTLILKQTKKEKGFNSAIKRYSFKGQIKYYKGNPKILIPPFGVNLLSVLEQLDKLKDELKEWFDKYGLKLVFDKGSQTLKILKTSGKDIFLLPYSSVADTLQRIIFYRTAVAANNDSVLLFEEPEAHAFPPYISSLTEDILRSKTNQFFITTHSPYILNDFLAIKDLSLSIYTVNYRNGQTVIKRLSEKEINEVYQKGIDLFFNSEYFD